MERSCDDCGRSYEAKRPNSRFCGDTCKKRAQRKPKVAAEPAGPSPAAAVPSVPSGLVEATRRELDTAGRLDTVLGQQALALAERVASPHETGASVATMSRELRAVMTEALKGVAAKADGVDEVKARRDAKRARFAG